MRLRLNTVLVLRLGLSNLSHTLSGWILEIMVRQKIKFSTLAIAISISALVFTPNNVNATGMYDMSAFLGQSHPFDIGSPQRTPAQPPVAQRPIMAAPI
ncbi:MAG: hypothetical protein ACKVG9_07260, partial [Rhodospirillales bacterium]